ncbi:MAG: hypothetical protein QXN04_11335 [Pyrobaculum sp.]
MRRSALVLGLLLLAAAATALTVKIHGVYMYVEVREDAFYTPSGWVNFTARLLAEPGRLEFNASQPIYIFWVGAPPNSAYLGRLVKLGNDPVFEDGRSIFNANAENITWFMRPDVFHLYYGNLSDWPSVFACRRADVTLIGYAEGSSADFQPAVCVNWRIVRFKWYGSEETPNTKIFHYVAADFAFRFERPGQVVTFWLAPNGTLYAAVGYTDYVRVTVEGDHVLYYHFIIPRERPRIAYGALAPWGHGLYLTVPWGGEGPLCLAPNVCISTASWTSPIALWNNTRLYYGTRYGAYALVVGEDGNFKPGYEVHRSPTEPRLRIDINRTKSFYEPLFVYLAGSKPYGVYLEKELEAAIHAAALAEALEKAVPDRGPYLITFRLVNTTHGTAFISPLIGRGGVFIGYAVYTPGERRLDIYRAVRKISDYFCIERGGVSEEENLRYMLSRLGITDYEYIAWRSPCYFVVRLKNGTAVGMGERDIYQLRLANTTYVEAPKPELPRYSVVVREERVPVYVNVTQTVTHTATQVITQNATQTVTATYTETAVETTTVQETAVERVTDTQNATQTVTATYTETAVETTTVQETAVERVTETVVRREVDWGAVALLSAASALAAAAAVWLARRR